MPSFTRATLDGTSFIHRQSNAVIPNLFGEELRQELTAGDSSAARALEKMKEQRRGQQPRRIAAQDRRQESRRYDLKLFETPWRSSPIEEKIIAGRFAEHLSEWRTLTSDPIVLEAIEGYCLPFTVPPPLTAGPPPRIRQRGKSREIDSEIEDLISKGVLEEIAADTPAFFSPYFGIPKKDGKIRLVIDLRALNRFVKADKFKMENLKLIPDLVTEGDFCAKIDMREAYFAIRIHPTHRRYLAIEWKGRVLQHTCLCFGLSSAPYIYTRVMRTIAEFLRARGVRLVHYLDDWGIFGSSERELRKHLDFARKVFSSLGLLINEEKSILIPNDRMEFLGLMVDTRRAKFEIPKDKRELTARLSEELLKDKRTSIRRVAKFLGTTNFLTLAAPGSVFHTRALQSLIKPVDPHSNKAYDKLITLTSEAREELQWWRTNIFSLPAISFIRFSPDVSIVTDASKMGWGAICCGARTGGRWSVTEAKNHINYLELLAMFFGLRCFAENWKEIDILLEGDNMAAISYLRDFGGNGSKDLNHLAEEIHKWAARRKLRISATHRPGIENKEADWESRNSLRENAEIALPQEVANMIFERWGKPQLDLFATRLNKKLPRFFSYFLDPDSEKVDAFRQSWWDLHAYAFPPFNLILRTLRKAQREKTRLILITPHWPSQPWWPLATEMCAEPPLLLPRRPDLITYPDGTKHELLQKKSFNLLAWKICQETGKEGASRAKQQQQCWPHGLEALRSSTTVVSEDGQSTASRSG